MIRKQGRDIIGDESEIIDSLISYIFTHNSLAMIDGIWKSMDIVIVVIQIVGFSGETQQPSLYVGPSDAMEQTIGFKELPTENEGFTWIYVPSNCKAFL